MKGIMFKPDMIQAIIEGRKTQTRRVIKIPDNGRIKDGSTFNDGFVMICFDQSGLADWKKQFAHYQQGETVYIKETHCINPRCTKVCFREQGDGCPYLSWRSPRFLKSEDARYFITITDVGAERLQEITLNDALAEGMNKMDLILQFRNLWNSINKDYPWENNPWVWVYTFRREE